MNDVEARVRKVFKEVLGNPVRLEELGSEQNLNDLGITSVNFIKIILVLEDEFNIQFEDEDLKFEELNTLQRVTAYVESKL
ncbi:MAG TPA: phosphopantetheine-binding protein [Bacillota bacterium]|nr:phosphopantetheine-binding protein [Bacillota bacterium]